MTAAVAPTGVYRFYDADEQLLYVGVSSNLRTRWKEHEDNRPWWGDIARHDVTWFATRAKALAEESRAICEDSPRYNSQGIVRAPESPHPTHTPVRRFRMGDEWIELGALVGDRRRSEVLRDLVGWYLRKPGAKLPKRPDVAE